MKLTFPLAVVLALLSSLVPHRGPARRRLPPPRHK
jgi:hypothetical protein